MDRRIYEQLLKIKKSGHNCSGEAVEYLRTHFFRQFRTHLDMRELVQNISLQEYHQRSILFLQGETIERYYFLLMGRVIIEEKFVKPNERCEKELLDREGIVGQFFYENNTRRQRKAETLPSQHSTVILSIDRKTFHRICSKQIDQYNQLKDKLCYLSQISKQNLQSKGLYRYLGFRKYRIGEWISFCELGPSLCYVIEGQCLQSSSKGMITLLEDDCLNLETFFSRTHKSQLKYRVISSQLQLLTISFEYLQKLPQRFRERLHFLHQNHQTAFRMIQSSLKLNSQKETQQRVAVQRKTMLPKLQIANNPNFGQNKNKQIYHKVKSHIRKKSKSAATLHQEIGSIGSFKNERSFDPNNQQNTDFLPKVELRQPKGYFNLEVISRKNNQIIIESKRKDWATYFLQKSKEKEKMHLKKKRNKFALKQMLTTSKSTLFFESVFKKKEMSQNMTPQKLQVSPSTKKARQSIKQNICQKY